MEIPSGLTGVLAFVVLLWPGFAYNSIRGRRRPVQQLTSLQETIVIVTASLTAVAVTGMVLSRGLRCGGSSVRSGQRQARYVRRPAPPVPVPATVASEAAAPVPAGGVAADCTASGHGA
jgi:hypothetical protein